MNYCPNCGHKLQEPAQRECAIPAFCDWRVHAYEYGKPTMWICAHGCVVTGHPRGYCDQGCCR